MPCNDLSFLILGAQPLWSSCWAWWAKVWSGDWPPAGSIFFSPSPALKPFFTPLPNTKSSIKRCLADLPVPWTTTQSEKCNKMQKQQWKKKLSMYQLIPLKFCSCSFTAASVLEFFHASRVEPPQDHKWIRQWQNSAGTAIGTFLHSAFYRTLKWLDFLGGGG